MICKTGNVKISSEGINQNRINKPNYNYGVTLQKNQRLVLH